MDKFKIFHRHRFLKIWLIAFACQAGQLFFPLEAKKPHSSKERKTGWFSRKSSQNAPKEQPNPNDSQQVKVKQEQQTQVPSKAVNPPQPDGKGKPQDEDGTLAYQPDRVTNGQWPSRVENAVFEQMAPDSVEKDFYHLETAQLPENGQWPSYSRSEILNEDAPHPFQPSISYPSSAAELDLLEKNGDMEHAQSTISNFVGEPPLEQQGVLPLDPTVGILPSEEPDSFVNKDVETIPTEQNTLSFPQMEIADDQFQIQSRNNQIPDSFQPNDDVTAEAPFSSTDVEAEQENSSFINENGRFNPTEPQETPQFTEQPQPSHFDEQIPLYTIPEQSQPIVEPISLQTDHFSNTPSLEEPSQDFSNPPIPVSDIPVPQDDRWTEQPVESTYFQNVIPAYVLPPPSQVHTDEDYPPSPAPQNTIMSENQTEDANVDSATYDLPSDQNLSNQGMPPIEGQPLPFPIEDDHMQNSQWVEQPVEPAYFQNVIPSYLFPAPQVCNVHEDGSPAPVDALMNENPAEGAIAPSFSPNALPTIQNFPIQEIPSVAGEPLPFPIENQFHPQFEQTDFNPEYVPSYLNNHADSDRGGENQKEQTTEQTATLSEGKSQVKIVKKQEPENQISEAIIGKQLVVDPIVGANIEESTNRKTKQVENQINKSTPFQQETIVQKSSGHSPFPESPLKNDPHSSDIAQQIPPPTAPTLPRVPTVITPTSPGPGGLQPNRNGQLKEISNINFNNVAIVEYIRFISRISNKNFIFDDEELQFNVTIVSEEPTTVENLMAALLQELRIRDLELLEQGNNIIIHRNPRVRAPARIVSDGTEPVSSQESELVTRVFRLNTLDPVKASEIIRPLLSDNALVEVLRDTNNLIITDLVTNVNKIAQLIGTLDAPNSGVTIGQYVVRNAFVDSLVDLATKILQPIAQGNPFVLVPHPVTNSIYIVSNSFLVEKALAILQNLDLNEGRTKILSLEGLQPSYAPPPLEEERPAPPRPTPITPPAPTIVPPVAPVPEIPPARPEGAPESYPLGGIGILPTPPAPAPFPLEPRPSAIFDETRDFLPGGIGAPTRWTRDLPVGHIERTLFYIYKLRYRRGDQIELALRKIGASLQLMGTANADLVSAINSSQWIESSNALIFSGTAVALDKVRELIMEVDVPLRQVFIEMLILDTTVRDSLSYSVDWANRFGGGSTTGEQGFLNPIPNASTAAFISTVEGLDPPIPPGEFPIATNFLDAGGFAAGVIGTHLTHDGLRFSTIGALVRALHTNSKANILLNPKIITEDNHTAEIFVGETDRYKTQSITNDLGTLVTNNFQFIDVGTTLRVTPLIGTNGIITLEIIQESTSPAATANLPGSASFQDFNLITVLTKTRTVTTIHVPNGFFVILSGMIQDNDIRAYSRIPCLGGIPIIGGIGKAQDVSDLKRNLMLFIRPLIVDTDDELEDITRRQQDIYREKSKFRRAWNYEVDESLNFLNIKPTDPDEIGCNER